MDRKTRHLICLDAAVGASCEPCTKFALGVLRELGAIASERLALSAHVHVVKLSDWPQTLKDLRGVAGKLGIAHVTFQPECVAEAQAIQFIPRQQ